MVTTSGNTANQRRKLVIHRGTSKPLPKDEHLLEERREAEGDEASNQSHSEDQVEGQLEAWSLRMTPEAYLERYPGGPNSELAEKHVNKS